MAKKRKPKKRKHAGHVPADAGGDEKAIEALGELQLRLVEVDPAGSGPVGGEVHQTLLKTRAEKKLVMRIIGSRDAHELGRLIEALKSGLAAPADSALNSYDPSVPSREFDPEQLKQAMRAYRKRLKLTRLDDESRISVSPMTGGKDSQIRAILPPHEYERDVWVELVRPGQLLDVGQGCFKLAEEHGAQG